MNKHIAAIVICPITSQSKNYPTRVKFELDGEPNWIVLDQIRTVDQIRIIKSIGKIETSIINKVKSIIKETFVD